MILGMNKAVSMPVTNADKSKNPPNRTMGTRRAANKNLAMVQMKQRIGF